MVDVELNHDLQKNSEASEWNIWSVLATSSRSVVFDSRKQGTLTLLIEKCACRTQMRSSQNPRTNIFTSRNQSHKFPSFILWFAQQLCPTHSTNLSVALEIIEHDFYVKTVACVLDVELTI